jgi:hypothetical protein
MPVGGGYYVTSAANIPHLFSAASAARRWFSRGVAGSL